MVKKKITSIIHRIQEYLQIDLFYIIKGEFWLMAGKIIGLASAFVLALAWANWIPAEVYGNYQYILSIVAIISVFSLPDLGTAIIQAVARGIEGSFITGFRTQLKWGMLASIASLIVAGYYWFYQNYTLALCFIIIAVFLPLFNASLVYLSFLGGRKKFDIQVKYDSITQLVAVSLLLLTLYFLKKLTPVYNISNLLSLCIIITVYFASRTSLRFFFFRKTKKKFSPNGKEDPKTIAYGKHLTFAGFIGTLSQHLDKVLLYHYLGAVEVAIFTFATLAERQIKSFLNQIGSLALPKFSVRAREELRESFLRKLNHLAGIVALIIIAYVIAAKWLFQLFFPQYMAAVPYSQVLALSAIPLCYSMISGVLKSKMMTKEIYQVKIIAPIIKIALSIILIPLYGIWGAAFSILLARSFNVFIYLWLFEKV